MNDDYHEWEGPVAFPLGALMAHDAYWRRQHWPAASGPMKPSGGERMRARLRKRYGDDCHWCGLGLGDDATIEHLTPRSQGGTNSMDNLRLAHRKCNR